MSVSGARSPGAPSNSTVHVLQISDDPELASTRLMILQNAGFRVEHRFSSVLKADGFHSFRVIVLCQSVEPHRAEQLAKRICAEAPEARILRIRHPLPDLVVADASISAPVGPTELVRAVEHLAHAQASHG